jgi:hypothetical protein
VGGAVLGRVVELDQAAAQPARPELGRPDLEVEIGLAAGFGDLAPTGADLVALAGVSMKPISLCIAEELGVREQQVAHLRRNLKSIVIFRIDCRVRNAGRRQNAR